MPKSRRDPTAEGNTYRAKRYDLESSDPTKVIPDSDISNYEICDLKMSDGGKPDDNIKDNNYSDPEKVIPNSHISASKVSDGGIPPDDAEDDDWRGDLKKSSVLMMKVIRSLRVTLSLMIRVRWMVMILPEFRSGKESSLLASNILLEGRGLYAFFRSSEIFENKISIRRRALGLYLLLASYG